MGYKKITITVEKDSFKKFKEYCKINGMKVSTRLQALIKRDLK